MRAVALTSPGVLAPAEIPEPTGADGVIVAVDEVGVCGTDLKIHSGKIAVQLPRVLGHELVGHVVDGATGLAPGARVLVNPSIVCGVCRACRAGRANLCPSGALMGRDVDGGMQERIAVHERQLHPLSESISRKAAALLQVLGTCVHAQRALPRPDPGLSVVVGLGVAGLLHLQLLRLSGFTHVVGIGRSPAKRELAAKLGAVAVCGPEDAEDVVRELSAGQGATVAVEAVGTVATLALTVRLCALGASLCVFGTITGEPEPSTFPWYDLYYKEVSLVNPRAALPRDYDEAILLAERHQLSLEPLFVRSVPLDDVQSAFSMLSESALAGKVTVAVSGFE